MASESALLTLQPSVVIRYAGLSALFISNQLVLLTHEHRGVRPGALRAQYQSAQRHGHGARFLQRLDQMIQAVRNGK